MDSAPGLDLTPDVETFDSHLRGKVKFAASVRGSVKKTV